MKLIAVCSVSAGAIALAVLTASSVLSETPTNAVWHTIWEDYDTGAYESIELTGMDRNGEIVTYTHEEGGQDGARVERRQSDCAAVTTMVITRQEINFTLETIGEVRIVNQTFDARIHSEYIPSLRDACHMSEHLLP